MALGAKLTGIQFFLRVRFWPFLACKMDSQETHRKCSIPASFQANSWKTKGIKTHRNFLGPLTIPFSNETIVPLFVVYRGVREFFLRVFQPAERKAIRDAN
jgi:hypothetical protein